MGATTLFLDDSPLSSVRLLFSDRTEPEAVTSGLVKISILAGSVDAVKRDWEISVRASSICLRTRSVSSCTSAEVRPSVDTGGRTAGSGDGAVWG